MAKPQRRWVWVKELSAAEKAAVGAVCERFIVETLKPRFRPEIVISPVRRGVCCRKSGTPVKRIARRCGFGSEETMHRSFRRLLAVTPQDYRSRFTF